MTNFHALHISFTSILQQFVFYILRTRTLLISISKVQVYFHCKYMLMEVQRHKEKSFLIIDICSVLYTITLDNMKLFISLVTLSAKISGVLIFVSDKVDFFDNGILNVYLILRLRLKFSEICSLNSLKFINQFSLIEGNCSTGRFIKFMRNFNFQNFKIGQTENCSIPFF